MYLIKILSTSEPTTPYLGRNSHLTSIYNAVCANKKHQRISHTTAKMTSIHSSQDYLPCTCPQYFLQNLHANHRRHRRGPQRLRLSLRARPYPRRTPSLTRHKHTSIPTRPPTEQIFRSNGNRALAPSLRRPARNPRNRSLALRSPRRADLDVRSRLAHSAPTRLRLLRIPLFSPD